MRGRLCYECDLLRKAENRCPSLSADSMRVEDQGLGNGGVCAIMPRSGRHRPSGPHRAGNMPRSKGSAAVSNAIADQERPNAGSIYLPSLRASDLRSRSIRRAKRAVCRMRPDGDGVAAGRRAAVADAVVGRRRRNQNAAACGTVALGYRRRLRRTVRRAILPSAHRPDLGDRRHLRHQAAPR